MLYVAATRGVINRKASWAHGNRNQRYKPAVTTAERVVQRVWAK